MRFHVDFISNSKKEYTVAVLLSLSYFLHILMFALQFLKIIVDFRFLLSIMKVITFYF